MELEPTPEELQEEQESLAEAKEDTIRASLAEALGLADDDTNKDVLDRAVKREMESRKKFSTVIGQKIKYREAAKGTAKAPESKALDAEAIRKQTAEDVQNRFNEEYLEDSEFSDEIKAEIREWTKFKGVSAKAATKAPHIATMIAEHKKELKNQEAAENGSGARQSGKDGAEGMPDKFMDPRYMSTPEGQKAYDEWEKSHKESKAKK